MAWQPTWAVSEVEDMATRVGKLDSTLNYEISRQGDIPKWEYPEATMKKIQELRSIGTTNKTLLRQDLDTLLEWPNARMCHPSYFYEANKGTENFPRSAKWLEDSGFQKFSTTYSFSNRWDRAAFEVAFYVPDDLKTGANVPIMWFFHGGGFCTGANDHIPWFGGPSFMHARRKGAIIIAPDYPLGPEGNYADICDSIRDFLRWYKENGYFKDETDSKSESWQKWITKKIDKTNITIDKDRVYVEGESAGGHAAVMALWINAAHDGPKLSIKSCLLRYPMLAHYARGFPKDKGKIVYMGESFTPSDVTKRAHDVVAAIDELEEWGLVPTRSKGYAPQYMSATFLLSLTKLWQPVFQRKHGKKIGSRGTIDPSVPDYMDCLDRVDKCVNSVDHNYLPPIGMYHGVQDTNCPIENTRIFQSILKEKYPVYQKKDAVFLHEVSSLNWKYSLVQAKKGSATRNEFTWQKIDKVEHAFDYDLDIAREPFLKDTYATIDKFWLS